MSLAYPVEGHIAMCLWPLALMRRPIRRGLMRFNVIRVYNVNDKSSSTLIGIMCECNKSFSSFVEVSTSRRLPSLLASLKPVPNRNMHARKRSVCH